MHVVHTRSYVVLTREAALELGARLQRRGRLARELRAQLEEEHQMLVIALTQLAVERGSGDREYFIRRWLREYRGQPEPATAAKARRRAAKKNGHG